MLQRVATSGAVYVTARAPQRDYGDLLAGAEAEVTAWGCIVRMGAQDNPAVFAHEYLHCLGFEHSADPDSLMFWALMPGQHLTSADVEALQAVGR